MELKELKREYEKSRKKFKLPSFEELNQAFEIEKLDQDTELLLRIVRKHMMDKIVNSLSFVEMLLNPVSAPRMYQGYVKLMTAQDRKNLEEIYRAFAELVVGSLEREIVYDEKGEAQMILRIFRTWRSIGEDFVKIFENIRRPRGNFVKKERSYFG